MNNSNLVVRYITERERVYIEESGFILPLRQIMPDAHIEYAQRRVCIPDFARDKALFALNTSELSKWQNHELFVDIMWYALLKHAYKKGDEGGLRAIYFSPQPEDDFYVLDWEPVEMDLTWGGVKPETWLKYLQSKVPLRNYGSNYTLPELITTKRIDKRRIVLEEIVAIEDKNFRFL